MHNSRIFEGKNSLFRDLEDEIHATSSPDSLSRFFFFVCMHLDDDAINMLERKSIEMILGGRSATRYRHMSFIIFG